jgi:thioester reductase-like protein
VYCLLRTTLPSQTALSRLEEALGTRNLKEITKSEKVFPLSSDLSKSDLGLQTPTLEKIKSEVTHIIHCAWEVNFALPVQSFTPQLASVQNLINLSLSSPFSTPSRVLFCSSVGTAMATPSQNSTAIIPEAPVQELSHASPTGYARSKLVAERIIDNAAASSGAYAIILRIGQITPAKSTGSQLWNPSKMRSALTTGALPDRPGGADRCSWIDVDTLAKAILEIGYVGKLGGKAEKSQLVYNLVHPRPFSWKEDLLPALKNAGLEFESTSWLNWLEKLKQSEEDVEKNPSRKLLGFWEEGSRGDGRGVVVFETKAAEASSEAMQTAGSAVSGDYIAQLLAAWRAVW